MNGVYHICPVHTLSIRNPVLIVESLDHMSENIKVVGYKTHDGLSIYMRTIPLRKIRIFFEC